MPQSPIDQTRPTEPQTLLGTYYNFKNNSSAVLVLNNKGAELLDAAVHFYSLSGAHHHTVTLTVGAADYREFDLAELLADAGNDFREGNFQIVFDGGHYQLGSQIKNIDESRSLIWEEQNFTAAAKYVSSKLEGVWWLPAAACETKFIITNTTNQPVTATVKIDGTLPPQILPATIQLNAHQTRVLKIFPDLVGIPVGVLNETGGVSISHTGAPGAVLARMLISRPDKGFSSTMSCLDPQLTASSKWHGAGLRLEKIDTLNLRQILAVRNAGTAATHFKGRIYYTKDDGTTTFVTVPRTSINARSSKAIDLRGLLAAANVPPGIRYGGLEMEYESAPGSVVMAALSFSEDENLVFQLPLYDPEKTASSAGGYPWKTSGDYTTFVYAKNDTDESQKFILSLNYEGGGYTLGVNEVKAHQTLMVDFKALRDSQTPDPMGNVIPLNISRGQIGWTSYGSRDHVINGRSEQFSLSKGLTTTYDCRNCCPNSYFDSWVTPDNVLGYVNETTGFAALQRDTNCYGQFYPPYYPNYLNWSSTDTNIATIGYYNGQAQAIGVGTATMQANITADRWVDDFYAADCEYTQLQIISDAFYEVQPPSVASLTASMPSTKNPVTNQAPAPGSFNTTNISTNFATETTTDFMVVFQSPTQSITVTADSINPPTSASQIKWHIDRDPTDTVASGTPTLSSQSGAQITLTPTTAGNFRLICYSDNNNSGSYEPGEELRVLLFSVVRVNVDSNNIKILRILGFQYSSPEPDKFAVVTQPGAMAIECEFVIEGGGANKRIGLNNLNFGNVGNLISDTAKVKYSNTGTATENPDGTMPVGGTLPVIDSMDDPSGGSTAFRSYSSLSKDNFAGGGQRVDGTSDDKPDFGSFLTVHPTTQNIWATTEGGYDFKEYIVGYSETFNRAYVVIAKADWTVRYIGSRNSSGEWANNGSTITLQGINQDEASFNITVNNGSPRTGDSEGIQVLGLSFANSHTPIYS